MICPALPRCPDAERTAIFTQGAIGTLTQTTAMTAAQRQAMGTAIQRLGRPPLLQVGNGCNLWMAAGFQALPFPQIALMQYTSAWQRRKVHDTQVTC